MTDICKTCGQHILMMCQKNTDYCSQRCQEEDE